MLKRLKLLSKKVSIINQLDRMSFTCFFIKFLLAKKWFLKSIMCARVKKAKQSIFWMLSHYKIMI